MTSSIDLSASDLTSFSRDQIRQALRTKRHSLNSKQQAEAAIHLLRLILKLPQFLKAKRVAIYLASDSEMDLTALAHQCWSMGKEVYLPVIHNIKSRELWFIRYEPDTPLIPNKYKILEPNPRTNQKLAAHLLDMVFLPLVGFDQQCHRLGMGGGFYDTAFAFKKQKTKSKPLLVGVAHECQKIAELPQAEWDVSLDWVVSDQAIYAREVPTA